MVFVTTLAVILLLIIHGLIALYDFAYFRIPNVLVLGVLILSVFWMIVALPFDKILFHLAVFAGMLVLGFGCFAFKWIGGGDAKYLAASSLWVGPEVFAQFLLWVSLVGGALSISYLTFKYAVPMLSDRVWAQMVKVEQKFPALRKVWVMSGDENQQGEGQRAIAQKSVPYGVAIAAGSWVILIGSL